MVVLRSASADIVSITGLLLLLQISAAAAAPLAHLIRALGAIVGSWRRVGGECAFQKLLPEVVWRSSDESEGHEAEQLDQVQGNGSLKIIFGQMVSYVISNHFKGMAISMYAYLMIDGWMGAHLVVESQPLPTYPFLVSLN